MSQKSTQHNAIIECLTPSLQTVFIWIRWVQDVYIRPPFNHDAVQQLNLSHAQHLFLTSFHWRKLDWKRDDTQDFQLSFNMLKWDGPIFWREISAPLLLWHTGSFIKKNRDTYHTSVPSSKYPYWLLTVTYSYRNYFISFSFLLVCYLYLKPIRNAFIYASCYRVCMLNLFVKTSKQQLFGEISIEPTLSFKIVFPHILPPYWFNILFELL